MKQKNNRQYQKGGSNLIYKTVQKCKRWRNRKYKVEIQGLHKMIRKQFQDNQKKKKKGGGGRNNYKLTAKLFYIIFINAMCLTM